PSVMRRYRIAPRACHEFPRSREPRVERHFRQKHQLAAFGPDVLHQAIPVRRKGRATVMKLTHSDFHAHLQHRLCRSTRCTYSQKRAGVSLQWVIAQYGPRCQASAQTFQESRKMIDLFYWTTPNGHKITMFLEEVGLAHRIVPVNIGKGEQFHPAFLAIAPNNRIPAIVDLEPAGGGEPIAWVDSGAILVYRAHKTGKLSASDSRGHVEVTQWLFWQMGGLGPMAGQNHHFSAYAPEKIPYAIDRYVKETNRLYGVLNKRLADREFVAGDY